MSERPHTRSLTRRASAVLLSATMALAVLAVAVHTPFVRARVLRYALAEVQARYAIRLEASRLDYSLPTLRIALADVRVSALGTPDEPFLEADYASVGLARRAFVGALAFDAIAMTNSRVRIVRRADGTTNLPAAPPAADGDPPPLEIARLDLPELAIDVDDERSDTSLSVPAVALHLIPGGGRVQLRTPAELRVGDRTSRISQLDGTVAFDGRALRVGDARVRTDEADVGVEGSILLIAADPQLDLRLQGTADVQRVARWGAGDGETPQGTVALEARVTGPVAGPQADVQLRSNRLAWRGLVATGLTARAQATPAALDVRELEFRLPQGSVEATALLPWDAAADGRVTASWSGIDASEIVRAVSPALRPRPAGTMAGRLQAAGPLADLHRLSADARVSISPVPLRASGVGTPRTAPGRLPLNGDARLRLRDGSWRLEGRQRIGELAPMTIALEGRLQRGRDGDRAPYRSTVAGAIRLARSDMRSLLDVLRTAGAADPPRDVVTSGTFDANIRLAGSLANPQVRAAIQVREISGSRFAAREADLTVSGDLVEPRMTFAATAADAEVAGESAGEVRAAGRLMGATLVFDEVIARQSAAGGLLAGTGQYDLNAAAYSVSLDALDWQLTATADRPVTGRASLTFGGRGTVAQPRGAGQLTVRGAMWEEIALGILDAAFRLDGDAATIRARAPDFRAEADGRVQLVAPYGATIDLRASQVDLARVLRGIEMPLAVRGTISLTAHAEGPLRTWRSGSATLDASSLDATAGDLTIRLVEPARARYEGQRLSIESFEAAVGEARLSMSGEMWAFDPAPASSALLVTMTGDLGEVARAAAATGITPLPIAGGTGPVALLARVTGTVQTPRIAGDLEVGPGSLVLRDAPAVSDVRLRAHAEEGWLELREAGAVYEGARLSATGRAPLTLLAGGNRGDARTVGELTLHARALNVTPAVLAPFISASTRERLAGSVDATLDVASPTLTLTDLRGELQFDRLDLRIAELPVTQRVPTRIVARDGFARVEAWNWAGEGATIDVRGQVRLSDRQTAILADGELDLRMLTPFVREIGMRTSGRVQPRLSITGTLDAPRIDGDVLVTGGELRLADPQVLVSDVDGRAILTGRSARLVSLTGLVNGGPLTGTGEVDVGSGGAIDARLSADVRGAALQFPEGLRSEVNATLTLALALDRGEPNSAGAPDAARGRLGGTVTVVRGAYREPLAVVAGLLTTLRSRRLAASAAPSPILDGLTLDVRLFTDEDIAVDNNYGRFDIGGDLRLIGTAAAPALSGRAELREGGRLFVGRNVYAITAGTVDFVNPAAIEPDLHVQAATRAGGEEIHVTISGTPDNLDVDLRSPTSPTLGQAELTSLLLTGRRFDDLAPGDATFVGTQVLGNFSAEVLGFAGQAIGLDSLRFGGPDAAAVRRDSVAAATELDPTTRLTFGKSLGDEVEVTFSQSLRDSAAQTWIIGYLPARQLELRLVSDDEDLRSYGLRHDLSFGGGARRLTASSDRPAARQETRVASVTLTSGGAQVAGGLQASGFVLRENEVRRLLRLEAGDRFDYAAWQADRDRIEAFYRQEGYLTARVTSTRSENGDEVTLAYSVTAGPRTSIAVTGIDLDQAVRSRLEAAWSQSVFDAFLIDEAAAIVREALARDGYLRPGVEVRIAADGDARTLAINVDQGSRYPDLGVRIEGAGESLAREIDAWLASTDLPRRAVTDPGGLERGLTMFLRSRGYVRARVAVGTPEVDASRASLPVNVDAGPIFTIADVVFDGSDAVPVDALHNEAALVGGMRYDPSATDAVRDRLVALYRREGYPSPAITVRETVDADALSVHVTFMVNAGVRQMVGNVVVAGNSAIDADVIIDALGLSAGDPLRAESSLAARRRVFDTGLFRRVDVAAEPLGTPAAGQPHLPMRVQVTVEEWPALRFRYGFQVAEERPEEQIEGRDLVPGFSADLTRRTVFGRAVTVGGAVELQRRERLGRVFASAPTLLGWPVESSIIGERSREELSAVTLMTERSRISWEQRAHAGRHLSLSYAYRFERNHTFDTQASPNPDFPTFDITVTLAWLTGSAAWDTRDDPSDTARGTLASSSLEFSPEFAGSDIRFVRQLAQAYHFRPWRRVVFASAARVGVVRPLAGQELIPSVRFFGGGSRTVRGVAEAGLGARDALGDPAGGEALLVFNQEVRLPVYRWLRGVAFVDAGSVFTRAAEMSLMDLAGSIGIGLRLSTPFALLRADYGKPVWGPVERSGRWTFGIGHAF